jgi:tetratricopeptide (TPR) repeat protein
MKVKQNYIAGGFISYLFLLSFLSQPDDLYPQHPTDSTQKSINIIIQKGDQLEKLFPDSALFYYQKGLELFENINESEEQRISKIKILLKIGWIFHTKFKYSFADDYYKRALLESESIQHDSLIGECNFNIAEINLENGSYAKAVEYYYNAKEKFRKISYSDGLYWSDMGLGIIYRELGNANLSQKHYHLAIKLAEKEGNNKYVAISYNNLGNLYRQVGQYKKALEHLYLALKNFESQGEDKLISDCLEGIGEVYSEINNEERALEYFKRSIAKAEFLGDDYRLLSKYANIANSFSKLGQKENALMYFSKTVELAQSIGDKARLSEILILVANFYKANNDFDNSLRHLKSSLSISQEVGDTVSIASAHSSLSELYFLKKDYVTAYNNALKAYQISSQKNLMKTLAESSFSISRILELQGNFKDALYYHKIHNRTKDNLLDLEKLKALEETEVKYNVEQIEKQKLELENAAIKDEESLKSLNNYLGALGILFLISVFTFGIFIYRKQNEKRMSTENSRQMRRKIDLLNTKLNEKNRELTSKALMISQHNEVLKDVVNSINEYSNGEHNNKNELKKLKTKLQEIYEEKSWDDFIQHFEQVHPNFYKKLLNKSNDLTPTEQKVCAFLKMNLNSKEISQITNQSTKAVEVMRSRIRKKLNIPHEDSLTKTIQIL